VNGRLAATGVSFVGGKSLQLIANNGGDMDLTDCSMSSVSVTYNSGSTGTVEYNTLSGMSINSGVDVVIINNNISGGSVSLSGNSSATIDLESNWWGSTDPGIIETKIYHHADNSSLPWADYEPFLVAPPTWGVPFSISLSGTEGDFAHDVLISWDSSEGAATLTGVHLEGEDVTHLVHSNSETSAYLPCFVPLYTDDYVLDFTRDMGGVSIQDSRAFGAVSAVDDLVDFSSSLPLDFMGAVLDQEWMRSAGRTFSILNWGLELRGLADAIDQGDRAAIAGSVLNLLENGLGELTPGAGLWLGAFNIAERALFAKPYEAMLPAEMYEQWTESGLLSRLAMDNAVFYDQMLDMYVRSHQPATGGWWLAPDLIPTTPDFGGGGNWVHPKLRSIEYQITEALLWLGQQAGRIGAAFEDLLHVELGSPVDLSIVDSQGGRFTLDSSDIPYCSTAVIDDGGHLKEQFFIYRPEGGDYTLEIVPKPEAEPEDTYSLAVTRREQTDVLASDDPIPETPAEFDREVIVGPEIDVLDNSENTLDQRVVFANGATEGRFFLFNSGDEPLNISDLAVIGPDETAFSISLMDDLGVPVNPDSFDIAPGLTYELAVYYSSMGVSAHSAAVEFTTNDPDDAEDAVLLNLVAFEPEIVGRYVFLNNSVWDGNGPLPDGPDDAAVIPGKEALLRDGTVSPANYTSHILGINGIMVDIDGLPGTPTADDFGIRVKDATAPDIWSTGPTPIISVRFGEGGNGSDRITLIWPDGEIQNQWVKVTVKATANTGLATDDVFSFCNVIGDCDGDGRVGDGDYRAFVSEFGRRGGIGTLAADFDSDGRVGLGDFAVLREILSDMTPGNNPPVAEDDAVETEENVPIVIDVLANDTDPDPGDGLSQATAPLSEARSDMAAVTVDNKAIFATGTTGNDSCSDRVDIYDAETDAWTTTTFPGTPRVYMPAVAHGGRAYFAGGYCQSNGYSAEVDIYDVDSDIWSALSLSQVRAHLAGAAVGDKVIFAGGSQSSYACTDRVDVYDTTTETWSTASLGLARNTLAGASVGHFALFAGGYNLITGDTDLVDIYDNQTGVWSTAHLSQARRVFERNVVVVGTKVIFAGGYYDDGGPNHYSDVVDIYDASTGDWSVTRLPHTRNAFASAVAGDLAIFAGGWVDESYQDVVDVFDTRDGTWSQLTLSAARRDLAGASVGNKAIFAGGSSYEYSGVVDIFEQITAHVETVPSHGEVAQNVDGSYTYTPNPGFNGTDTFTYRAYDGELYSEPATVTVTVNPVNSAPDLATASPLVPVQVKSNIDSLGTSSILDDEQGGVVRGDFGPDVILSISAARYLAATAEYDLRPLSGDPPTDGEVDDLLADILAESALALPL